MKITREVILDLLPVYLAGEASSATRALIEEYLKTDLELAQQIKTQWMEKLSRVVPSPLPPELELKALDRTKRLLAWQRRLFGIAFGLCALPASVVFWREDGQVRHRFLLWDAPALYGTLLAVGIACWVAYFLIRRRLRAMPH